mgnify:CR=1 FL=1
MEKNLANEDKKIKGKCASCGASIKPSEKVCSYCGSPNTDYVEPVVKDIMPPEEIKDDDFDLGGMLGGMMGGMMMGGMLRGFRGHRPRRRR